MIADVANQALFPHLAAVAESARWRMEEVPWSAFDGGRVTPGLQSLAREMAFSEHTTFSATQRFMQAFGDDVDFTQWLSVWFYEETRHPQVLMRWLSLAGESVDSTFIIRGRVSSPFMKSRIGTLVTNIISEITASQAYLGLSLSAPEPLLRELARRLASDEARHAASFYCYARQNLARAELPERERLDALKVLYFWLNESHNVTHPVNQMVQKTQSLEAESGVRFEVGALRTKICLTVGRLVGLELASPAEVEPALARLTAIVHHGG